MNPSVYIIILNWNGKELTQECIESLSKVNYDNFKILVVDNGSVDDSVNTIKKEYSDIDVLELENNIGYAAGNNVGFNSLKINPDYVIFLNNDTEVDPNFIKPLINPLIENSEIGQTVPKIFYANEKNIIWYAGGKVNLWLGLVYHIGIRKANSDKYNDSKFTVYATGCCFAIRYVDFAKLGGFDSEFPMYAEDVDLSLRIQANGKKILFIPKSQIWHKISASIGGEFAIIKFKRKLVGLVKLFKKHASIFQKVTILLYWIVSIPFQIVKLIFLFLKR